MHSLAVTNEVCTMPVFRPLIGFDKQEIVDIPKKSVRTRHLFCRMRTAARSLPRRTPKTNPTLDEILAAEAAMPGLAALEAESRRERRENLYPHGR